MSTFPLSWRAGTQSQAGRFLCTILHQNTDQAADGPLLPRLHTRLISPHAIACGPNLCLHVFGDHSALLRNEPYTRLLPRVLQLYHRRMRAFPEGFAQAPMEQRAAIVQALWDDHARTAPIARPQHAGDHPQPPQGHVWLPYDRFPTPTIHVCWPHHAASSGQSNPVTPHCVNALVGCFASVFPSFFEGPAEKAQVLRAHYAPDSPLVMTLGKEKATLPARARTLLLNAIPELAHLLGASVWRTSARPGTAAGSRHAFTLSTYAGHSAHNRIAAQAAWRGGLSPAQHDAWNAMLARLR